MNRRAYLGRESIFKFKMCLFMPKRCTLLAPALISPAKTSKIMLSSYYFMLINPKKAKETIYNTIGWLIDFIRLIN